MAWTDPQTFATNESPLTSTKLNTNLRDNMRELWHEVAYVEFAATVTASAGVNTEAAPLDVVSSGAVTYIAAPTLVEFYCPISKFTSTAGAVLGGISLWDSATDLGRLLTQSGTSETNSGEVYAARRFTPTAASHTYKVRIWAGTGASAVVSAGAGGVGVTLPGYIRVLQRGG
jgi:hypothetical protein